MNIEASDTAFQVDRAAYFANTRKVIAPLLPNEFKTVLEIGCGEGNTLEWLQFEYGPLEALGIEIDQEAAEVARSRGIQVNVHDIETSPLPLAEGSIDVLLCLDVLEHLRDPWSTLANLVCYLRPGGYVIASIPNVAHISVLLGLVFGDEWQYQPAGILDRTHLRFFTGRTSKELLKSADLNVDMVRRRYARKTHRRFNVLTAGLFRRFLTFQYLIRGRKRIDQAG